MIKSTLALPVTLAALLAGAPSPAAAESADPATWAAQAAALATDAARAAFGGRTDVRVEVVVGTLDPRLRLAPCGEVRLHLPPGQRAWGRTRIGARCVQGPVAWNVYLPLTVRLHAPALVAMQALPAGTVLQEQHLALAETDWAASDSPVLTGAELAVGRTLAQAVAAGSALREADLKRRVWFAAGDPVKVIARGPGFAVAGEAVALAPGLDGQSVRVRTESGRQLTGVATGLRQVEVSM